MHFELIELLGLKIAQNIKLALFRFIFYCNRYTDHFTMAEICPSCDAPVYSAEKAAISGRNGEVWHKQCMKCRTCRKRLDSVTFNEHKGIYSLPTFYYLLLNVYVINRSLCLSVKSKTSFNAYLV